MIPGLLTDPACDGSNGARADADCASWLDAEYMDEQQAARRIAWQTRDLDRKLSADSEELTTW